MRYGDHFDHMDGGGWVFAAVMLVLMVALAVAAIVWLTRARHMQSTSHVVAGGGGGSARELLDRRLVAGEIGEEEYRRLRTTLAEAAGPSESADPPPKPL
jgi:uncharacterized membrane protein